ncbi:hypothetical protein LINGRAHAP2_LOCUS8869, partial [Linum grandiflorum]
TLLLLPPPPRHRLPRPPPRRRRSESIAEQLVRRRIITRRASTEEYGSGRGGNGRLRFGTRRRRHAFGLERSTLPRMLPGLTIGRRSSFGAKRLRRIFRQRSTAEWRRLVAAAVRFVV